MDWLPVATFVLGQVVVIVLAFIQNRFQTEKEQRLGEAARLEVRREFQRETLLNLQSALHDLGRAWASMYHEDDMAFHRTGKWGGNQYASDLSDREVDARIRVAMYASRVNDDDARQTSEKLLKVGSSYVRSKDDAEATRIWFESLQLLHGTTSRVGEVLRSL